MQVIGKILESNLTTICSGSPKSPTTSLPSRDANTKRMDLVFSRFAAFYGHVWRSQFKNEGFMEFAKKEWHGALTIFSDEVLAKAMRHCRDCCDMPPTLPQLIEICRNLKKRSDFVVSSPKTPRVLSATAMSHLNQCKAILMK